MLSYIGHTCARPVDGEGCLEEVSQNGTLRISQNLGQQDLVASLLRASRPNGNLAANPLPI